MELHLPPDTEALLTQHAIAAGVSIEEFAKQKLSEIAKAKQSQRINREQNIHELPEHLEVNQLAQEQGVGLIKDFRDLQADFWPEGETIEVFLSDVRSRRSQDASRIR